MFRGGAIQTLPHGADPPLEAKNSLPSHFGKSDFAVHAMWVSENGSPKVAHESKLAD